MRPQAGVDISARVGRIANTPPAVLDHATRILHQQK